jgi:hypothetical protein
VGSYIGIQKIAAKRAGVTYEQYLERIASGLKWCDVCETWLKQDRFGKDRSRWDGLAAHCLKCRKNQYYRVYQPKPKVIRRGRRFVPARDGDKKQARSRVNNLVKRGLLPDPNSIPCVDCGHIYDGKTRHEYDHYLGYAARSHESVESVCATCHGERTSARGETKAARRNDGSNEN